MAAAATARRAAAPARALSRKAPARKKPVALKVAPARQAPARKAAPARRSAPTRRPGGQLIPIAVGTATAVRHLPDSNLMVRMTRGRVWIGVLGVLLAGIVTVNVITLSLAASAGHVDQNIMALEQENSLLRGRDAERSGATRVRHEAGVLGLAPSTTEQIDSVQAGPHDAAVAAQRLAAAGTGY